MALIYFAKPLVASNYSSTTTKGYAHWQGFANTNCMNPIRKFYDEYKPYIFSDGWYYVFIVVFIIILFIFFS